MKKDTIIERIYLDWAAATPLLPEAFLAMEPFLRNEFGNPGAIHAEGVAARRAVEGARDGVARSLQVRPEFVTFTSGGTESNNIAILGLVETLHKDSREYSDMEVVTTRIEHPSVTATMRHLVELGVTVKYVEVDEEGVIKLEELRKLLSGKTVLMSCSYVNSEIGVIQPVRNIKKLLVESEAKNNSKIFFHVDAAQAPLWLTCQFDSVGADLLTLDAGKCCGPKGIGVLVQSKRVHVSPVTFGGGQESGLRPGTENVAGVVGASVAFLFAQGGWKERIEKVSKIRDESINYILENIQGSVLNGPAGENRVANNINISIIGLDTEYATVVLDKKGFAVSTKSACAGAGGGESKVVKEISADPARALSTLRITLGPETTFEQVKKLADALAEHQSKTKNLTQ